MQEKLGAGAPLVPGEGAEAPASYTEPTRDELDQSQTIPPDMVRSSRPPGHWERATSLTRNCAFFCFPKLPLFFILACILLLNASEISLSLFLEKKLLLVVAWLE